MNLTVEQKAEMFDKLNDAITGSKVKLHVGCGFFLKDENLKSEFMAFMTALRPDDVNEYGVSSLLLSPIDFILKLNQEESGSQLVDKKVNPLVNVYIMKNSVNGLFKIGMTSKHPKYRESTLQSQEPEVSLVFYGLCNRSVERELHDKFSDLRVRGEWFRLSPKNVSGAIGLINNRVGEANEMV